MVDLPFQLAGPLAERLAEAADVEGKLVRVLDSLGALAGREVVLLDAPAAGVADESGAGLARRLEAAGIATIRLPAPVPLRLELPDGSVDAVVSLWSGFRGVAEGELEEVDRVLRPGGRLLVVHDYGRDDVCVLRAVDAPEYTLWSRREGPFLRDGGFKIRVVHCFWTFDTMEDAAAFLGEAFGDRGTALAGRLRRPRLSWNVAVYHRVRGAVTPAAGAATSRQRGASSGRSPGASAPGAPSLA